MLKQDTPDHHPNLTTLTIEYDVNVMESVKYATGPLLVEVERHPGEELGLILSDERCDAGPEDIYKAGIFIERIIPASVADRYFLSTSSNFRAHQLFKRPFGLSRCGALHVGDQILGVDDANMEGDAMTPQDAMHMLQTFNMAEGCSKLQILPHHVVNKSQQGSWPDRGGEWEGIRLGQGLKKVFVPRPGGAEHPEHFRLQHDLEEAVQEAFCAAGRGGQR